MGELVGLEDIRDDGEGVGECFSVFGGGSICEVVG